MKPKVHYEHEGKKYFMGYRRDMPDPVHERRMMASREQVKALPPSVILNDPTPVEDQGQLGSCTGNASDNASKIRGAIAGAKWFNGSRLAMYYLARQHDGTVQDGDVGSTLSSVAWVLENKGIAPETEWSYNINQYNTPPPQSYLNDAVNDKTTVATRVDTAQYDPTASQTTLNNLKSALNSGYPVMIGFTVYQNFFNTGSDGNMPMPSGGIAGGHAVCVTGYDDNHRNLDGSVGALWIKNSWGTGWGASGRFWMPYAFILANNSDFADCWAIVTESDFGPVPPPPPAGVNFASSPAVCSQGVGMRDEFNIGSDKALWWRTLAGGKWTAWTSLGGLCFNNPACCAAPVKGVLFAAVIGSDNAIWVKLYLNGTWSPWKGILGIALKGSSPSITAESATVAEAAVMGTNNALYTKAMTAGVWGGWTQEAAKIK